MIRQRTLAGAAVLLGACAPEVPVQTPFDTTAAPIARGTPVALYGQAVQAHVASWLPLLAEAG